MELEEHIKNLKEYCRIDREIIDADYNDFYEFCRNHVEDIEAVVAAYEKAEARANEFYRCLRDEAVSKQEIQELRDEIDKNINWNNADDHYYAITILNRLLKEK